jgi:nucleotide-binding universal stress UspA family protein
MSKARIVVGVDGSDSSQAALRWALWHAGQASRQVSAVIAWQRPVSYDWLPQGIDGNFAADAESTLAEAIAATDGLAPEVTVLPQVSEGHPVDVLLGAAQGAELLVLGCRGRGGFAAALVGSVSLHCTMRAHCSVLIVRDQP